MQFGNLASKCWHLELLGVAFDINFFKHGLLFFGPFSGIRSISDEGYGWNMIEQILSLPHRVWVLL